MPLHDPHAQRLYLDGCLEAGAIIACSPSQANYLVSVLRLKPGAEILVFNGRHGEWRAALEVVGKRGVRLHVMAQVRGQQAGPDLDYLFAPLKRARLDYVVQKATELGVARLRPVITRRTIAERVNVARMRANVIEAAEQCGVLRVPEVDAPVKLGQALAQWDPARPLVFCDEAAEIANPIRALQQGLNGPASGLCPPVAVIVGPEGGFDAHERGALLSLPFTVPISLGPRVMRADTAAVAALALINATLGDWR